MDPDSQIGRDHLAPDRSCANRCAGVARQTLAIVNIHAINFELSPDTYRAQLGALADALAWSSRARSFSQATSTPGAASATASSPKLPCDWDLTELTLQVDRRAVFYGHHLDHIFVRGLRLIDVGATPVTSSDHNPVTATLAIP